MKSLTDRINDAIRQIPDFPQKGILFKDISPIFLDWKLIDDITIAIIANLKEKPDAICAIESRGFFIGTLLANKLQIPLLMVRKKGKLPGEVISYDYTLEYGNATLELSKGFIQPGWNVLIHDDILATGGTALAAAELIKMENGKVAGFCFIGSLDFLGGEEKLKKTTENIYTVVKM